MPPFDLSLSLARAALRVESAPPPGPPSGSLPLAVLRWGDLPPEVRTAHFNLGSPADDFELPAEQVAFYCFNHGTARALSFASALPLSSLEDAEHLAGWRPKSLALLKAVQLWRRTAP